MWGLLEFIFLTGSQLMLFLWGSHWENHWPAWSVFQITIIYLSGTLYLLGSLQAIYNFYFINRHYTQNPTGTRGYTVKSLPLLSHPDCPLVSQLVSCVFPEIDTQANIYIFFVLFFHTNANLLDTWFRPIIFPLSIS